MPTYDVVGLGVAACDYLTELETFPPPDRKVRTSRFEIDGGGTVGNALVALTRLGLRTAYLGVLGDDEFGRTARSSLERSGVDVSAVQIARGARSPFSFCVSAPPGRNVFSIAPTTPPLELDAIAIARALDSRFVHLDGSEERAAVDLARAAHAAGVGVSLDLQRLRANNDALLASADVVVVGESYAQEAWPRLPPEQAVLRLYQPHLQLAGITLGARGCVATTGGDFIRLDAEPVDEMVDTTGAGDAFHGALLAALLHGHEAIESLRFASRVAAMSCRGLGGRAGLPTRDEVGDWL